MSRKKASRFTHVDLNEFDVRWNTGNEITIQQLVDLSTAMKAEFGGMSTVRIGDDHRMAVITEPAAEKPKRVTGHVLQTALAACRRDMERYQRMPVGLGDTLGDI